MKNELKLTRAEKDLLIEKLIKFFYNERNEEIGNLAAELLLDFICKNIAPHFYNNGIRDSITYISERIEDMYGLEKI